MPRGAPSKYDPSFNKQIFKLALLGAKDNQIADFLEIAESTLNNWKIEYPDLLETLKAGKLQADAKVAACLYKRALGYSYEERTFEKTMIISVNEAGEEIQTPGTLVKIVKKKVAPDTTAQIFWLKNRQPEQWREKQEYEHSGSIEGLSMTIKPKK